jgi:hypothetical protein
VAYVSGALFALHGDDGFRGYCGMGSCVHGFPMVVYNTLDCCYFVQKRTAAVARDNPVAVWTLIG